MNPDPCLTLYARIKLSWTPDMKGRAETRSLLEVNKECLSDLRVGKDLLESTESSDPKRKSDVLDFITIRRLCSSKDIIKE